MSFDLYTKGVLAVVAVFLGVIALEYSIAPKIIPTGPGMAPGYWVERDGKVRHCIHGTDMHQCHEWFKSTKQ